MVLARAGGGTKHSSLATGAPVNFKAGLSRDQQIPRKLNQTHYGQMLTLGDLGQGVLLIRDSLESDGGFLLLQLLKLALQAPEGCDVVLVAARHTTAHYTQTLRKAGVSLPALVEQRRLGVVDVMQRLAQAGTTEQERLVNLRELVAEVVGSAAAGAGSDCGGGGRPLCLLVDDLTVRERGSGACAGAATSVSAVHISGQLKAALAAVFLQVLRCVAANADSCWPAFLNSCCGLGSTLQVGPWLCLYWLAAVGRIQSEQVPRPRCGAETLLLCGPGAQGCGGRQPLARQARHQGLGAWQRSAGAAQPCTRPHLLGKGPCLLPGSGA